MALLWWMVDGRVITFRTVFRGVPVSLAIFFPPLVLQRTTNAVVLVCGTAV